MEVGGAYSNTKNQVSALQQLLDQLSEGGRGRAEYQSQHARAGRARQLDEHQVQQLIQGYEAGATVYELATTFDIGRNTVCRLLHRHGVTLRRRGLSTEQITHAAELYTHGQSTTELAPRFGVDERTLCRALRTRGLTLCGPQGRSSDRKAGGHQ